MARRHPKSNQKTSQAAKMRRGKTRGRNLTWLWVGLAVLGIVAVGIFAASLKTPSSNGITSSQTSTPSEISPAQAYAMFQQGAFFLDVRSQDEWNQFHVAGSTLIPLDELAGRVSELPMDKDIVVVCLSGHRSQSGTSILQQAGFTRVYCLSGGLQAWMDANYPVEQGN